MQDIARTLFSLNKAHQLVIDIKPPAAMPGKGVQACLQENVARLGEYGTQLVLGCGDGFYLARANCDAMVAERVAAGIVGTSKLLPVATFFFEFDKITAFGDSSLDRTHSAWVDLARQLIRGCGPMSLKKEMSV